MLLDISGAAGALWLVLLLVHTATGSFAGLKLLNRNLILVILFGILNQFITKILDYIIYNSIDLYYFIRKYWDGNFIYKIYLI